jgi:uncharacterized membrane protein YgdD (TMEM256/DUF423 family)
MNHGRFFLVVGALSGLLTVAFGAFAAHGLKHQMPTEMLLVFNKGALYQGLHAPALLATGIMSTQHSSRALTIAGWSFLLGILLFSGSLYLLSMTGNTRLGIITPFGGLSFLIGWLSLLIAGWNYSR